MSRQPRRPIHDDFDGAWKNMLSERRCADFIAFFMPDIFDQIDWSRPVTFLEQELRAITRKTKQGEKAVDRLIQVWLKDGGEQWVLVHVEIQSQKEEGFAFRLFRYYFRGLDYFDGRPLTCLVILGDTNVSWHPTGYQQAWWGTSVDFRYRTVKLSDFSQRLAELERSSNPFARFVLAHLKTLETQGQYETRLEWKLRIIQGLYAMGYSEAEIGSLYHDFDWLLKLPAGLERRYHVTMKIFEEDRSMKHLTTAERIGLAQGLKEGRATGRAEGRVEGLAIGEAKGIRDSIREILEVRNEAITPEWLERLEAIEDLDHLRQLRKLLFAGGSVSDFVQALQHGNGR